ncbi:MAG TPA: PRC-barrel domain-containing protein, partial [Gemmatimonadaceae bacterium]|nr:PRC-barrel domain-containing protein [Gemmatimonadaceae bacterium]
ELKNFKVADGDSDIRGWDVKTADGRTIGKVNELIVDPAERRVRYLDVKVKKEILLADDDRHVLVPIGTARLDDRHDDVLIERLPAQGLAGVPPYRPGPITRDYETSLREYYGASAVEPSADYYRHDIYDDKGLHRRSSTERSADTIDRDRDRDHTRDRSAAVDSSMMPQLGDNQVTVPLVGDQEVVIRRPGSDQEIVVRKSTANDDVVDR